MKNKTTAKKKSPAVLGNLNNLQMFAIGDKAQGNMQTCKSGGRLMSCLAFELCFCYEIIICELRIMVCELDFDYKQNFHRKLV